MKLPQSSGEVALISWDQPQHLTEDPRLPSSALQALPEEATAKEDLELGIPSFAMSKFIRGMIAMLSCIRRDQVLSGLNRTQRHYCECLKPHRNYTSAARGVLCIQAPGPEIVLGHYHSFA